jgi:hypothetical protein
MRFPFQKSPRSQINGFKPKTRAHFDASEVLKKLQVGDFTLHRNIGTSERKSGFSQK